jgi:hypothetical protein
MALEVPTPKSWTELFYVYINQDLLTISVKIVANPVLLGQVIEGKPQ